MNEYCSIEDLKGYRGIGDEENQDDDLLRGFCTSASRAWERLCGGRLFYPASATKYFDHPEDDTVLKLTGEDLLEVTTFTTANGTDTVTSGEYYLMCGNSYNLTPYNKIKMKSSGTQPVLNYSGTTQQANAITGIWGYHEDWSNAWLDSQDTVQDAAGISAAATTITVSNAQGENIYGITPRFKAQQLIKIDSEYMYITAKNKVTSNTLAVVRGVNGTTAATHANGTAIYIFDVWEDVFQIVRRLAAWLYQQKDSNSDIDRPIVTDAGVTLLPSALPKDVIQAAVGYRR